MNKSKILKRSLAVILAMMMIFAMIPLSASAAAPSITRFTVNAVDAAISGTDITAKSTSTTVYLGFDAAPGVSAAIIDTDGNLRNGPLDTTWKLDGVTAISLTTAKLAKVNGNVYTITIGASQAVDGDDAPEVTKYTLTITLDQSGAVKETGISSIKGITNMISYDIDGTEVTINMPLDTAKITLTDTNFVLTGAADHATVSNLGTEDATTGSLKNMVVTAPDGVTTAKYNVTVKYGASFDSFTVEDQDGDSVITDTTDTTHEVAIKLPYDYKDAVEDGATKKFVPTFTLAEGVKYITEFTAAAYNDKTVVSGETELALKYTEATRVYAGKVKVWTDKDTPVTVDIKLTAAEKNPEYELEQIQIVNGSLKSNVIDVEGNSVTVEMPETFVAATATAGDVNVKASKGAKVEIQAQTKTLNPATGSLDQLATGVNLTAKKLVIRVTSQADPTKYQDYTVNITVAAKDEAKLRDFSVKNLTTDELFEAVIDESAKTVVLTLPYAYVVPAKLALLRVYASATTGATIDGTAQASLPALWNAALPHMPVANASTPTVWRVEAPNGAHQDYAVSLKLEAPKTGRLISAAEATSAITAKAVNEDNTYSVVVGTDGNNKKTLRLAIPYSTPNADTAIYFTDLQLSEGAAAYAYDGANFVKVRSFDQADEDGVAAKPAKLMNTNGIYGSAYAFDVVAGGKLAAAVEGSFPHMLVIVSESVAAKLGETVSEADFKDDAAADWDPTNKVFKKATIYYIYGVKDEANTEANVKSMECSLNENVAASVGSDTISIKVPGSYNIAKAGTETTAEKAADKAKADKLTFTLNFAVSKMAKARLNVDDTVILASDEGDEDVVRAKNASTFFVWDGNLYYMNQAALSQPSVSATNVKQVTGNATATDNGIHVLAEAGTKNNYPVILTIGTLEKGAELTGVKASFGSAVVDGVISSNIVTIAAPFGAKLNPAKLALTYSKYASVKVSSTAGTFADPYDPNKYYDLTSSLYVQVTSEDKATANVYTLKASTAAQFDDVKEGSWYYDSVMKAAAAGIIVGYNGKFRPSNDVTRQDFAVMVVNMLGADVSSYTTPAFKDCEANYAMEEIAYLKDKGIIVGDPEGTFRPTATITRSEVAVIIAKALNLSATTEEKFADDASIQNWAKEAAYKCKAAKIMVGNQDGNFKPKSNLTRAEAAQIMVMSQAKK